jgi:hypothetical protein
MPEINFTLEGRKYLMSFEDDGKGNEFAIVTSDKGNTKRIICKGYHCNGSMIAFFKTVKELFIGE